MLRLRKSFRLAPGVRLSVGRRTASASIGTRRLRANVSKAGAAGSVRVLPGITYLTRRWRPNKETDQ